MNFTTQIPVAKTNCPIDYSSRIISVGSCFAENISEKFSWFKFRNTVNPFGILFHPLAIENMFRRFSADALFSENDIFYHNEQWHSFDLHSVMSHTDKSVFLSHINKAVGVHHAELKTMTHCIITLGTAWVYRHKESGKIVANCHKVPQNQFTKELLSVEDIRQSLENIYMLLKQMNPDLHCIFTISPVRHIKDGFTENQVSKAHLISALHHFLSKLNSPPFWGGVGGGDYFPSYEILMDELRDYRFYAADMLHPSQTAIDYIWSRFAEMQIAETAFAVMKEVDTIQKALTHKPFNPLSDAHQKFLQEITQKADNLHRRFPEIRFF